MQFFYIPIAISHQIPMISYHFPASNVDISKLPALKFIYMETWRVLRFYHVYHVSDFFIIIDYLFCPTFYSLT